MIKTLTCLALAVLVAGCSMANDMFEPPAGTQASVGEEQKMPPAVAGWSGRAETASGSSDERQGFAEPDDGYALDTGDRLRVFVYGQPNLSRIYPLDQSGHIAVPLIGAVKARGLTSQRLAQIIRNRLASQYVKDPQITVDIAQYRPFYVLGEVRNAGQYPYAGGLTVRSAVAIAGGFSERADERVVQITRRVGGMTEKIDVPDEFVVQPGDTIYVYERFL